MAHQEFGVRLLERIRTELEPFAIVEQFPKMEGRQLVMVMSPKKGGKAPVKAVVAAPGGAAAAVVKPAVKPVVVSAAPAAVVVAAAKVAAPSVGVEKKP